MKRLLLLIFIANVIIFSSCSEDETKSYRVTNNLSYIASSDHYYNGNLYEVVAFQYKGNEIIKQDNLGTITCGGGISKIIDVENNCEKVRVSFKILPPESQYYNESYNYRRYTVTYYYLKTGAINEIKIDGTTFVSGQLKSTIDNSSKSMKEVIDELFINLKEV